MFSAGFEIFENVLDHGECEALIHHLCGDETRAGFRHLMADPMVSKFATDERLISITEQVVGQRLTPYKATLFQKTGKANWLVSWHQDTALPMESEPQDEEWGPASIKDGVTFVHAPTWALSRILALRIHLDASTIENGPLRVIPGSHEKRVVDEKEFNEWTSRERAECSVTRGGVIAMSPLLIHASSKCVSDEPRRVLHVEYVDRIQLSPSLRLAIA